VSATPAESESSGNPLGDPKSTTSYALSGRRAKGIKPLRRFQTRYNDIAELEVADGDRIFKIIMKRPIEASKETLDTWSKQIRKTYELLSASTQADSKVRFPRLVGTFDSGQGLAMEYAPGERLDSLLQSPWKEKTPERALSAVESVGEWLSGFHAAHRDQEGGLPRKYPLWIRPYQQTSGRAIPIHQSLAEMGVEEGRAGAFLKKLAEVTLAVTNSIQFTTTTYGDFRVWNMLVARDATYIIDFPTTLFVDSPWRDICAFLTSVDYVLARPRAFLARVTLKPEQVKSRFVAAYFGSSHVDGAALELMEVPAMVASWEDLKAFHGIRDAVTRTWLEWRIKRVVSRCVEGAN